MGAIDNLVRPSILTLNPYASAREKFMDYSLTLLDANENPWGPVGSDGQPGLLNRYPDPYQRALKERLSQIKDHPSHGIFLGNGSDEIIDLLIRIFCEPKEDEILVTAPTYGMYKVSAHINNVAVKEVPLTQDFGLDVPGLRRKIAPSTKIIFLCSPNNPTGNLLLPEDILEIVKAFKGIVVVDEAYMDFADDQGFISFIAEYFNLVVLQTFSKAWGLAGIRLGVAYSSPQIVRFLNKVKPPYNVNQLTQQRAMSALENMDQLNSLISKTKTARNALASQLSMLSLVQEVYPSQANFLLVKVDNPGKVFNLLINEQVIVRDRSNVHLCEGCLRITVGTENENRLLLKALNKISL